MVRPRCQLCDNPPTADAPGVNCCSPFQVAKPRIVDPFGMYHVMSRGNYRRTIYPTTEHLQRYLFLLNRVTARQRWIIVDWCLMPNHFHLLIQLTMGGLSEGMRELNGCYSRWSNAVHELTGTGHLVRNRFKGKLVDTESYLLQLLRYIPLNPVRSDLVQLPEDWPWSGYRATLGLEQPQPFHRPQEILRQFGHDLGAARSAYQQHVYLGLAEAGDDPWSDHTVDLGAA